MTPKRETPWRGIAILLGILLCAVLFAAALVVSGIISSGSRCFRVEALFSRTAGSR